MAAPITMEDLKPVAGDNAITGTTRINQVDDYLRGTQSIIRKSVEGITVSLSSNSVTLNASNFEYVLSGSGTLSNMYGLVPDGVATIYMTGIVTVTSGDTLETSTHHLVSGDSIVVKKLSTGVFKVIGVNKVSALVYANGNTVTGQCTLPTDSNAVVLSGSTAITAFTGGVLGRIYILTTDYNTSVLGTAFNVGDIMILACASNGSGYYIKGVTKQPYVQNAFVIGGNIAGGFEDYTSNLKNVWLNHTITLPVGKWIIHWGISWGRGLGMGQTTNRAYATGRWLNVGGSGDGIYNPNFQLTIANQHTASMQTGSVYVDCNVPRTFQPIIDDCDHGDNGIIAVGKQDRFANRNYLYATYLGA